ncbi:hypothetical protein ACFSX9_13120 [Flavobacterium ardleyense]|uniref:Uncharacterized protein n=1 Tax=Flavobacterium ardleyense TaxID=2038737 RepID=A0ABW5ZAL0_9FLAO
MLKIISLMNQLKKIQKIFSVFHDGTIQNWKGNLEKLHIEVSCQYLAEIIDTSFDCFYIELQKIDKLELFTVIDNKIDNEINEPKIIQNIKAIFNNEIDIFHAKIVENYVEINCWQINEQENYVANNLLLSCNNIKVFNQNKIEISIEKLFEISDYYWAKF